VLVVNTQTLTHPPQANTDVQVISLVSVAHACSHFFHLFLPSLFPFFIQEFHFSFAELGLLTTVFFAVSGIGQALCGFLVDRYGATRILTLGLSCLSLGAFIASQASGYGGLVAAAIVLGAGNAVFHPVDYTVINRRVSSPRLGHAYSAHSISGTLGWALAPVLVVGLASMSGWRIAAVCAGVMALAVLVLLRWREQAVFVAPTWGSSILKNIDAPASNGLAFMRLPAVWLCFGFFLASAITIGAMSNFAVPALKALFALPLDLASFTLSAYLVFAALGTFVGGFAVAQNKRSDRVIAVGMGIGVLLLAIVASAQISSSIAVILLTVSGFGIGIANPSRDMLIKRSTPTGASGRVYGVVYSGLDVGLGLSPLMLGIAMDKGHPQAVFGLAALALLLAIGLALLLGTRLAQATSAKVS
jgi:MFS transporter, FSR family, fosmidomycin resistance protein